MARRRRARENPDAALWIFAAVGVVAVGGVVYVMTRPTAASTTPTTATPPVTSKPGIPTNLTYVVNGQVVTTQYTPNPANLATDIANAITLANAGHGAGKEGEAWVARANLDGGGPNELAQLQAVGYRG